MIHNIRVDSRFGYKVQLHNIILIHLAGTKYIIEENKTLNRF